MSDDVAAIARDLEAVIATANAALDRLRALPARAPDARSDVELDDWARPGRIVSEFEISRSHLHRLCTLHPISEPTGFALRVGARFLISRPRFERYARSNGLRRRETK
ncbi:hypothetical protein EI171_21085 [Bradyrhizobium sp. LCT2]|uniref:hypothetical protein n=1 Tax=Bradyrhizobium sp. LCT2 TaxID=2493093 RepID=UPI001373CE0B|nr:hypothetical protein [Bradyrhizobium sp. LCT2]QHP69562.1 hypothetical protein EI171_21085 [Bradyrhizobium sp. LCT2]